MFTSTMDLSGRFDGTPTGSFNIWVVNIDGTGLRPLTHNSKAGLDSDTASFSPDGTRIVFRSRASLDRLPDGIPVGGENAWIVNVDGSDLRPLTSFATQSAQNPVFAPDGTRVYFDANVDAAGNPIAGDNIYAVPVAGGSLIPITSDNTHFASQPAVSPDGTRVIFTTNADPGVSNVGSARNLWISLADGSAQQPLTRSTDANFSIQARVFSPDGIRIAFISSLALDMQDSSPAFSNGTQNLWVMDTSGAHRLNLTSNSTSPKASPDAPAFTPEGSGILFISTLRLSGSFTDPPFPSTVNIWKASVSGGPLTHLTGYDSSTHGAGLGNFLRDQSRIVYASFVLEGGVSSGSSNIWVMNPDGSGAMPLTHNTLAGFDSTLNKSVAPVYQPAIPCLGN